MPKRLLKMRLNGEAVEVDIEPGAMLADVLRNELGLTGTKVACGEGECGACTVILDGKVINSCITPAMKAMNKEVLTIEGVAPGPGKLHPLQEAFIEHGAVQCGYCTPGMILSAKALLDENPSPTEHEVRVGLSGNLCRCTGYVKIVEAVLAAAEKMHK
ncbi:MAG: (2Fe-2S)-binding protein [Dehalococcoidia bacterium]|nr:(2Fe-2S)-binding protein [Dehalococcoidia bacterium]